MMDYQAILVEEEEYVINLWLNRPKVHNAINGEMINDLYHFFNSVACNRKARVVIIRGKGNSFCSGADLNWMKDVSEYNYDQNFLDSQTFAKCLYAMNSCTKVVIAVVHGSIMGGANGLIAASDIVLAEENTKFALSEVSLGLVPAVISPYVVNKAGHSNARKMMLSGDAITASEALRTGLIHYLEPASEMEGKLDQVINQVLKNSPEAIFKTKELLQKLPELQSPEQIIKYTSEVIAKARISEDGQHGMTSFFKKEKPSWVVTAEKMKSH